MNASRRTRGHQAVRVLRHALILAAASLPGLMSSTAAQAADTDRVLVSFAAGASAADRSAGIAAVGGRSAGTVRRLGVDVVEVPQGRAEAAARALSARSTVRWAEADGTLAPAEVVPDDYHWPAQWSQVITHTHEAWETTTGAASTVIAVLDTGVDLAQPDLQGALVPGYDVNGGDADPSDDHGHGTGSAGVVGAQAGNGIGGSGSCPGCRVMPVKVTGADGTAYWS